MSQPMSTVVVRGINIDSHYLVDAYDNGRLYGMTQHHGLHRQPIARHTEISLPRFGSMGSMMMAHSNHFIRGNYLGDQQFHSNSNNGDGVHALVWYHSLPMSYVQAPTALTTVWRRYHGRAGRGRRHRFLHRQYHHAQPLLDIRGHSNFHPSVNALSYRVPTNPSSRQHRQHAPFAGNMRNLPPRAFLQDNEVPSLIDPHIDMRLDIDHMSYEELLELGEWIGNVDKGLLDDIIARQMRTKTYLLPNDLEGSSSGEQESDICIICQDEYKNKEEIGILQCRHEYHADCIRRWLHEKNVCPMCKSKALTIV